MDDKERIERLACDLEPVQLSDAPFLYELLEQRPAIVNISHKELPTYDEHMDFILSNPYQYWAVIIHEKKKVGSVYLTFLNEIGIHILEEFQGQGFGTMAVEAILNYFGPRRFLANISPLNIMSQKFFTEIGFKHIQETYELEVKNEADS